MRDFGGFGGLEELFGGGRGGGGPRAGADVKINVPLTLAEVATGVEKKIIVKMLDPCDRCDGSRARSRARRRRRARRAAGRAKCVARSARSSASSSPSRRVPTCHGEGTDRPVAVQEVSRRRTRCAASSELTVQIPPGVATGQYMTLRGVGNAGARGGPRGDVHVLFEVADDPRFERDGEDLYTEVLVTYPQLVLGAELERADGRRSHDARRAGRNAERSASFHLRGRGLPRVNASGTGDLHVRVQLWTPERLTERSASSSRGSASCSPAFRPTAAARASGRR